MDVPDELDKRIISELRKDSRKSVRDLAKGLGESPSTIYNRRKRLEERGIIKNFTVHLDYKKIELAYVSFLLFKVNLDHEKRIRDVASELQKLDSVYEVHIITGQYNIMAKFRTNSPEELSKLILDQINSIKGIIEIETFLVLETEKEENDVFNPFKGIPTQ